MNNVSREKDAVDLFREFQKIRLNLDRVGTPHLSQIKEIVKRIHFADIINDQQVLDNKGDAFYKIYEKDEGDKFNNLTLSYTIAPKHTGLVYGLFKEIPDSNGNKKTTFEYGKFNNYARFLADITSSKVIYSKELKRFVIVQKNAFKEIDETVFSYEYPIDKKQQIPGFLSVLEEIYGKHIKVKTHDYIIQPFSFSGKDWIYDCSQLKLDLRQPKGNELFFTSYDVAYNEFNFEMADKFLNLIADDENSLNNVSLLHAYVLLRKLKIVPPEHFFILKDFGRTGKGLLMTTFDSVFKVNKVDFDKLMAGGFEASNEWLKFYGTDIAHANETDEITAKEMRILRMIATGETKTGREIGKDAVRFKIQSVLALDTNESVDISSISANKSRTVKIAFKDRPKGETDGERHAIFKPYWDFIQPKGEQSLAANLSFLISSLDYLKQQGGKFKFGSVALKNYRDADDLTETQRILVVVIHRDGFILASDPTLAQAVIDDYGSFRYQKAKDDVKKIGVKLNKPKWIEGQNFKVHVVDDEKTFNQIVDLLKQSEEVI
ncbi:MAG: phage resistance protein [Enterococcus durans]